MNAAPLHVLMVEDDGDFFATTREMLAASDRMKTELAWAADYERGLEYLRAGSFDVALVDLHLGARNGLDLLREIRRESIDTPVIMITADTDPQHDDEALAAGAADHIVKSRMNEYRLVRSIRYTIERKRAADALRASEQKFRSVTQSAHDGIIAADPQGRIISWNAGAQSMFGYREDEIIGRPIMSLLPERCHADYGTRVAPASNSDAASPVFEAVGISESGFEFAIELSVSKWQTAEGECISWIVRDITQRRAAEARLAEERNLLRTMIETIPDRVYVKDIEGRYVLDNEAHRRQIGAKRIEDIAGKTVHDFFTPAVAARFEADDRLVIRSGRPLLEREESRIDAAGNEDWMLTSKVPLQDVNGKLVGILGISRNITERKRAAEERERNAQALGAALAELRKSHEELKATQLILIQTEKMESLGRLAAGIAHEVKNPLSQIMLAADFLTNALPKNDATLTMVLDDIRGAVMRADKIVRGLLDFSAPKELSLRVQDLNAAVRQSLVLMKPGLLSGHVEVDVTFGEGLPPVEIDELKIEQVFINLCTNAIHAMPDGGTLTIRTYTMQLTDSGRDEGAKRNDRLRVGDHVVVAELCDTGHGIPPAKLALIYDPFFTTKPAGKGTGLGLTVSRKIVELHGGRLQIENRPGGGVRASVIFPAKGGESAGPRDQPTKQPS
jgi:PAS domain S-box-containing protein